jgi:hypothetical protein
MHRKAPAFRIGAFIKRRNVMKHLFLLLFCILLCASAATAGKAAARRTPVAKPVPWISLMDTGSWKLTKAYQNIRKWSYTDSTFEGSDGWIGHQMMVGDLILEGDFLYNGNSQGGVLIRGDRNAWLPWLHGYEMDIDADMPGTGHIHFPYRPQPNPGVVPFPMGKWQHFSIMALGQDVRVSLNGKEVIKFHDDHYRYGQICLEGEKGGLLFRNLKIQNLDKTPPKGARSPYAELFDGESMANWKPAGSVTIANGILEMDGTKTLSEITLSSVPFIKDAVVELDVWCKRGEKSCAPFRVNLHPGNGMKGPGFTCRPTSVTSCGNGSCTSQFPMYAEMKCPETWRFELVGKKTEVFRYGEKVMTCIDSASPARGIAISADSCLLLVRGVRYRDLVKKGNSAKRE